MIHYNCIYFLFQVFEIAAYVWLGTCKKAFGQKGNKDAQIQIQDCLHKHFPYISYVKFLKQQLHTCMRLGSTCKKAFDQKVTKMYRFKFETICMILVITIAFSSYSTQFNCTTIINMSHICDNINMSCSAIKLWYGIYFIRSQLSISGAEFMLWHAAKCMHSFVNDCPILAAVSL